MEFKPGAYSKGDTVIVNGFTYVADVDIKNALAIPKENQYWSLVTAEPIPAPVVKSTDLVPDFLPTNTPEQNSNAVEKFMGLIPYGACPSVYIPYGNYRLARPFEIDSKPIRLYGDNGTIWGNGSKLIFDNHGIVIKRTKGFQGAIIERLCLVAANQNTQGCSGLTMRARATVRDCTAKGFSHNGFDVWASIEGEGTDASGSRFDNCHSLENLHDGFFAGRTDANAISFIGCDSRDNKQYGFNDDSFLGNYYFGCMAHNNSKGHYYVRDKGNARTTLIACYGEMGSPPNDLSKLTTITGGFLANGNINIT